MPLRLEARFLTVYGSVPSCSLGATNRRRSLVSMERVNPRLIVAHGDLSVGNRAFVASKHAPRILPLIPVCCADVSCVVTSLAACNAGRLPKKPCSMTVVLPPQVVFLCNLSRIGVTACCRRLFQRPGKMAFAAFRPILRPHLLTIAGNYWRRTLDLERFPTREKLYNTEPGVQSLCIRKT